MPGNDNMANNASIIKKVFLLDPPDPTAVKPMTNISGTSMLAMPKAILVNILMPSLTHGITFS